MLLNKHTRYTRDALKGIRLPRTVKTDLVAGASANDLCEFTNEWGLFTWAKDKIGSLFAARARHVGDLAIWQSHFGVLASLHAMSKTPGEPAATTMGEVESWFKFLGGLALGQIPIDPGSTIGSDGTPIDGLFSGLHIRYEQLFDSDDLAQIRSRAVGMMLHLIQDSFTPCHCHREANAEIAEFYCYELQNWKKHRDADDALPADRENLIAECADCVTSILSRQQPYNYSTILTLRADPNNSGAGPYQ